MSSRVAAVIGLGLVGGSVARELAQLGWHVAAHDSDPATLAAACEEHVVHEPLDAALAGLRRAEVVILAVPVLTAPALLAHTAPHLHPDALVMDTGSTKRSIVEAAEVNGLGAQFVGAHPLAGDHRGGWSASRPGLFQGATVFLARTTTTTATALARAAALWTSLGAHPMSVDAGVHDERMARVSHLPQLAASVLACVLDAAGATAEQLGPGGRSTLRLAASPASTWTDIALDNRTALLPLLADVRSALSDLESALTHEDARAVTAMLEQARAWMRTQPAPAHAAVGRELRPGARRSDL